MIDISAKFDLCGVAYVYRGYKINGCINLSIEISGYAEVVNTYVVNSESTYYLIPEIEGQAFSYNEYYINSRIDLKLFIEISGYGRIYNGIELPATLRKFRDMPLNQDTKDYIANFIARIKPEDINYNVDPLFNRYRSYLPEFGSIPFTESFNHEIDNQIKIVNLTLDNLPITPGKPVIWGMVLVLYEGYPASILVNQGYKNNDAQRFIIDELVYKNMIDYIWSLFCTEANIGYHTYKPDDAPTIQKTRSFGLIERLIRELQ